jgi:hypothetical protein
MVPGVNTVVLHFQIDEFYPVAPSLQLEPPVPFLVKLSCGTTFVRGRNQNQLFTGDEAEPVSVPMIQVVWEVRAIYQQDRCNNNAFRNSFL